VGTPGRVGHGVRSSGDSDDRSAPAPLHCTHDLERSCTVGTGDDKARRERLSRYGVPFLDNVPWQAGASTIGKGGVSYDRQLHSTALLHALARLSLQDDSWLALSDAKRWNKGTCTQMTMTKSRHGYGTGTTAASFLAANLSAPRSRLNAATFPNSCKRHALE